MQYGNLERLDKMLGYPEIFSTDPSKGPHLLSSNVRQDDREMGEGPQLSICVSNPWTTVNIIM